MKMSGAAKAVYIPTVAGLIVFSIILIGILLDALSEGSAKYIGFAALGLAPFSIHEPISSGKAEPKVGIWIKDASDPVSPGWHLRHHDGGRFVEIEDADQRGINAAEWIRRDDSLGVR